jgi:hypothetical protein
MKFKDLKISVFYGKSTHVGFCPVCKANLYTYTKTIGNKLGVSQYVCEADHNFEKSNRVLTEFRKWQEKINPNTTTMYRPVNDKELALISEMDYKGFPPRLPEQPIFYPVINEAYAQRLNKWNLDQYGVGFITKFEVRTTYFNSFKVQNVGGFGDNELWVPAEDLVEFNNNIIGKIQVL